MRARLRKKALRWRLPTPTTPQEAEGVATALRRSGRRAIAVRADVTKPTDVRALVAKVLDTWDALDVLVNNAGIIRRTSVAATSLKHWDEVVATNLTGAFLCSQAAGPALRRPGGAS